VTNKRNKKSAKRSRAEKINLAKFSWTMLKVGLSALAWGLTVIAVMILWFSQDLPDLNALKAGERSPSITIQTQEGEILATYGDLYEDVVNVDELPPYVPQALMAVEDRRFYYHFGIDFVGLLRAAYTNYKAKRVVQGGSTLTQQLAKTILFSEGKYPVNDRSVKRKIQELILSFWLEWKFNKKQILTLYINRVYLGSGAYGIDAAARRYFSKSARQLTVFEAAIIAGLLKAPSKYSPAQNPKRASERAKIVLQLMVDAGFITSYESYLEQGERELSTLHGESNAGIRFFTDWIYENIPNLVGKTDQDIIVVTTIDPLMQKHGENVCQRKIEEKGKEYKVTESSLIAMTPDGAIKAMVGGLNYNKSQFNRATQAIRQPGSAFKNVVYLAAMESGYTPDSMIEDTPVEFGKWKPKNYKWPSRGEISLKEAFAHSVNSVAIRLTHAIGPSKVAETAKRLGITSHMIQDLSISLGTCETTLLEMATTFATFANQGQAVWPYGITEIKTKKGEVLYAHTPPEPRTIVATMPLLHMRELLRGAVANGSGRVANIDESVSGKTGSNGDRDAWFFGYRETPPENIDTVKGFTNVVVGVWVGNDNNKPMAKMSTGGRLPTQIIADFLKGSTAEFFENRQKKLEIIKTPKTQTKDQVQLDQLIKGIG
jgi:penicillin-binding protein 1A